MPRKLVPASVGILTRSSLSLEHPLGNFRRNKLSHKEPDGLKDAVKKVVVHIIGSILLSIPILYALAGILDVTGLIPGWGFWHGPVIIAGPVCVLIAFAVLLAVRWFRRD